MVRMTSAALLILLPGAAALSLPEPDDVSDMTKATELWRESHEAKFKSRDGWLALVGMQWLDDERAYRFGTAADNDIVLPRGTSSEHAGSLTVSTDAIRIDVVDDGLMSVNGAATTSATLQIDRTKDESDSPDQIRLGERIGLQLVRRTGRLAIRIRDAQSESIQRFMGKSWFPVDSSARVEAIYTAYETPQLTEIENVRGQKLRGEWSGFVTFDLGGAKQRLDVTQESDGGLFITFRDATSGKTTYGAGRFLDTAPPENGRVALDFNRCYSPPCAWSEFTLCPLPPKGNHMTIAIEAGERTP